MTPSPWPLGQFIRTRRIALGLRQAQVAKSAGIGQSTWSTLEVRCQYLSEVFVEPVARALQCSRDQLLMFTRGYQQESRTELGRLIRARRCELKLSIAELAARWGVSKSVAANFDRGGSATLPCALLPMLAKALGLDAYRLFPFAAHYPLERSSGLGRLISFERLAQGLTGWDLAKRAKITRQYLGLIELGEIGLVQANNPSLGRLAEALGLDISRLKAQVVYRTLGKRLSKPQLKGTGLTLFHSAFKGLEPTLFCPPATELTHHRPREGKRVDMVLPGVPELTLGDWLFNRRRELGLTRVALAKKASVSSSTICMIEAPADQASQYAPKLSTLRLIAQALGTKPPVGLLPPKLKTKARITLSPSTIKALAEIQLQLQSDESFDQIVQRALQLLLVQAEMFQPPSQPPVQ
ncbi:MAG: helix-turn-helix domain-containing protein [bacterium]